MTIDDGGSFGGSGGGGVRLGRKIDPQYENPFDEALLLVIEAISPALKATGHTPNVLTLYSGILGVGAVWALWHRKLAAFAVLYIASYFFDCADGYFARRYDMVTELGDKLDHGKDALVALALVGVLIVKYQLPFWAWLVLGALLLAMVSHLGCQQKAYVSNNRPPSDPPESMDVYRGLCPSADGETGMRMTRWVGVGTMQLAFVALVLLTSRTRVVA